MKVTKKDNTKFAIDDGDDDPQGTWHYKSAVLIIDPSTGKVIDLMKPNYFYDNIYKHYSSFSTER